MIVANGLAVLEAAYLESDLIGDNQVIPDKMAIFSYSSIDGNGAYVGLKGYIGSGVTFDKLIPIFNNTGLAKLPKSGTMTTDGSFVYTVLSGDISSLGSPVIVGQVIINGSVFPASISYSAFPVVAGSVITLFGLPNMADVSSLNFILQ